MISVCIATYNGDKYIERQLKSILCQLSSVDEIIISDDSSTDNTLGIISSFNDDRIKVFSNQKFQSPIFNFEHAIKQAAGEVIFLADQDDIWMEDKVFKTLSALEKNDLVVSNAEIVDEDLNVVFESFFEWRSSRKGILKNLIKNSYLGCCIAFRKEILIKVLPFPKNIPMHDSWIGLITEIYYKPIFIEDKLIMYRRHNNNVTILTSEYKSKESLTNKIKFRFNLLVALISRMIKLFLIKVS